MKLIKRTYYKTALWLLPVMIIGILFCFYMIEYIAYEETDEFLWYQMERLQQYYAQNKSLPEFHKVANIIPDVNHKVPFFKDTLILELGDNEMVPYRELHFSITHKGKNFGIVLHHLLLGKDDIAEGTFLIVVGLMFLMSVFIILILNITASKIWHPFYATLALLKNYKIEDPLPTFLHTDVDEFRSLNNTLQALLKKIHDDYKNNKQFNENASHELQTHLAVIRANTEKMIDRSSQGIHMDSLSKIYDASNKLSQIQKSLLLLSKINNREYSNNVDVPLHEVIVRSLNVFAEVAHLRNITIKENIQPITVFMDAGLAEIMINNLVKNAVKYNIDNGFISIELHSDAFIIQNAGNKKMQNPEIMFERFEKGSDGNMGIGLAIVKQICDLYGFRLHYSISNKYDHSLSVLF